MKTLFNTLWNTFVAIAIIAMVTVFLSPPAHADDEKAKVKEDKVKIKTDDEKVKVKEGEIEGTTDKVKVKTDDSKVKMKEGEDGGEEKVLIKNPDEKVKIKEDKAKVKVDGGKAKIKADGEIKVKGENGDEAAAIAAEELAREAARERTDAKIRANAR